MTASSDSMRPARKRQRSSALGMRTTPKRATQGNHRRISEDREDRRSFTRSGPSESFRHYEKNPSQAGRNSTTAGWLRQPRRVQSGKRRAMSQPGIKSSGATFEEVAPEFPVRASSCLLAAQRTPRAWWMPVRSENRMVLSTTIGTSEVTWVLTDVGSTSSLT